MKIPSSLLSALPLAVLPLAAGACAAPKVTEFRGSLAIRNGNIVTMNDALPRANAMVVRKGRIMAIGRWSDVSEQAKDLRILDLRGRTVVPGFVDARVNFADLARSLEDADDAGDAQDAGDARGPKRGFELATRHALARGVTTVHAFDGTAGGEADPERLRELRARQPDLPLRFVNYPSRLPRHRIPGTPRLLDGGAIDGELADGRAALSEPYAGTDDHGELLRSDEELYALLAPAHQEGYQLSFRVNGDRGLDQLLDALDQALREAPRADHRHRVEALGLVRPDQYERMRQLALVVVPLPGQLTGTTPETWSEVLGPERAEWVGPIHSLVAQRLVAALGSDAPRAPLGTLGGIQDVVHHPLRPTESASVEEALRMATRSGAWAAHEEHDKGTLEVGKLGDFIVLDRDPFIDWRDLDSLVVELTVVGGEIVYQLEDAAP